MVRQSGSETLQRQSVGSSTLSPAKSLGIQASSILKVADRLKQGLPYRSLTRLQERSGLSMEAIGTVVRIPRRTLARRKVEGKLTPSESERLYRLAQVFEKAVQLFEGNTAAARRWLESPNLAFADRTPLEMAETEVGAQEVQDLIMRLEFGVLP